MATLKRPTFEESFPLIEKEINKRKSKWQLDSITYMDFDDVKMMILHHIYLKWDQYDPSLPLANYLNRIISNQMINISKSIYGIFKRPCLSCACAENSDTFCRIFGTQNLECPILAKWHETKKNQHDIKLPLSLEYHGNEASHTTNSDINIHDSSKRLHKRMKEILTAYEWKVYEFLYIKNKSEDLLPKYMGYKTTEKSRKSGYRQIHITKKSILAKTRKAIASEDFDVFYG